MTAAAGGSRSSSSTNSQRNLTGTFPCRPSGRGSKPPGTRIRCAHVPGKIPKTHSFNPFFFTHHSNRVQKEEISPRAGPYARIRSRREVIPLFPLVHCQKKGPAPPAHKYHVLPYPSRDTRRDRVNGRVRGEGGGPNPPPILSIKLGGHPPPHVAERTGISPPIWKNFDDDAQLRVC